MFEVKKEESSFLYYILAFIAIYLLMKLLAPNCLEGFYAPKKSKKPSLIQKTGKAISKAVSPKKSSKRSSKKSAKKTTTAGTQGSKITQLKSAKAAKSDNEATVTDATVTDETVTVTDATVTDATVTEEPVSEDVASEEAVSEEAVTEESVSEDV